MLARNAGSMRDASVGISGAKELWYAAVYLHHARSFSCSREKIKFQNFPQIRFLKKVLGDTGILRKIGQHDKSKFMLRRAASRLVRSEAKPRVHPPTKTGNSLPLHGAFSVRTQQPDSADGGQRFQTARPFRLSSQTWSHAGDTSHCFRFADAAPPFMR